MIYNLLLGFYLSLHFLNHHHHPPQKKRDKNTTPKGEEIINGPKKKPLFLSFTTLFKLNKVIFL